MHTKCLSDDAAPGDRVAVGTGDREIALGCRIDDRQAMIVLLPRRLRSGRPGLPPLQLVDRNERVITRQKIHGNSNLPDRANYAKGRNWPAFRAGGPPTAYAISRHCARRNPSLAGGRGRGFDTPSPYQISRFYAQTCPTLGETR
jgi:hypothetical protein